MGRLIERDLNGEMTTKVRIIIDNALETVNKEHVRNLLLLNLVKRQTVGIFTAVRHL
jgi:hypothetical protein